MLNTLQTKCIRPLYMFRRALHSEYLITTECDGTREITLDHAKTKNSLSLDMMNFLIEAINNNKDDKSLRAIVLSAKGNIFSGGHNLKELQSDVGIDQHKLIFSTASELMRSIIQSPVPVIAKVNAFVPAAGCQLVATCDMIVCTDTSKFSTPGANFGVFCSTPGIALARCIPKSRATYMLFTGEPITAQEAYESGLVTKVTTEDELDNEVKKIIDKIKHKSRSVVALGKEFFYKQVDMPLLDAYKLGEEIIVRGINTCDGQEGIKSFIEKRKPTWKHE